MAEMNCLCEADVLAKAPVSLRVVRVSDVAIVRPDGEGFSLSGRTQAKPGEYKALRVRIDDEEWFVVERPQGGFWGARRSSCFGGYILDLGEVQMTLNNSSSSQGSSQGELSWDDEF